MSVITFAELLDSLSDECKAFVSEAEQVVQVSNLSADDARVVVDSCTALGWASAAFDAAGSEWAHTDLAPEFAPFRVAIRKPEAPPNTLQVLTNVGFSKWLTSGHEAQRWYIARLPTVFRTHGRIFGGWHSSIESFQLSAPTKSPRSLVREHGSLRTVPADIRPWLLKESELSIFDDATFQIWGNAALSALARALADEIDAENQALKFKGPPRLSITISSPPSNPVATLGKGPFLALQAAASWCYENEREAEMRHVLLATELALSGGGETDAAICFGKHISGALEGAKIAYQMSLSEIGRDTIKVLADLRKAITEETAKVTETIRQLVTSVAGALAIGLGLIAARLSTNTHPALITAVMLVVTAYVVVVILSGLQFVNLQRRLREDWQPRLYRFLPESDYKRMVTLPASHVERTYRWTAVISGLMVVALLSVVVVLHASLQHTSASNAQIALPQSEDLEKAPGNQQETAAKSKAQLPGGVPNNIDIGNKVGGTARTTKASGSTGARANQHSPKSP